MTQYGLVLSRWMSRLVVSASALVPGGHYARGRGQGTGPCPEKQQGVAYISTSAYPLFFFDIIMSHKTIICYQNDSWIFATSTCNLENQNCTFWPFCAKNHWPTTQFLAHFIQKSLGRPTREKFFDYLDKSWSFWAIFGIAQIRARSTSVDFERF